MNQLIHDIRPIIKWAGSKWLLAEKLIPLFPNHMRYIEVFAGTASVLIRKPQSRVEVLNDFHSELINFYLILVNRYDDLMGRIKWFVATEKLFEYYKHLEPRDDLERALKFFYISWYSYVGWQGAPNFQVNRYKHTNRIIQEDRFHTFRRRIKNVQILQRSYANLIPDFDFEDSFFFCDPPYYKLGNKNYVYAFKHSDHENLAEILKTIKGKFLLTYNECEEVKALYSWANIKPTILNYSAGHKKDKPARKQTELIITNYETEPKPKKRINPIGWIQ